MKFHKQRHRHRPERGEFGDCFRTALACILDHEPEEIPNFGIFHNDGRRFTAEVQSWLRAEGLVLITVAVDGGTTLQDALSMTSGINTGILCLFAGTSRTGCNHSVVACSGQIIHDPSLDDAGIVGPCSDGNYYLEFLVPAGLIYQPLAERVA